MVEKVTEGVEKEAQARPQPEPTSEEVEAAKGNLGPVHHASTGVDESETETTDVPSQQNEPRESPDSIAESEKSTQRKRRSRKEEDQA